MTLRSLLSRWRADSSIGPNVVEWRTLPERLPRFMPFPDDLHPALAEALRGQGIQNLYSHQSASWRFTSDGQNVVIVTGTASGKTLCFNLPVIDCLLRYSDARALYLYPTKALAQDQLSLIHGLVASIANWRQGIGDLGNSSPIAYPLSPAVYDGDTPASARPAIRREARLVISNPDMLHTGILPHHTSWAEFFHNLRFIVIDEMHIYRGVFGSHVANLARRLKRVARFYGAKPQFILTSATIANPAELAGWLIEEPVTLVDEDGSARGAKHFLIYNPPVVDRDLGVRRSSLQESVRLVEDLLDENIQTILFGVTRRSVEIMLRYLQEKAREQRSTGGSTGAPLLPGSPAQIRGYRSGYLPLQRREIERGLRSGEVRAVVATSALELGIDIGGMEAALLAGYPGTIAAAWQQAGRSGRTNDASLSVLVASANPLDQFLARHPEYFFDRSPERGLINPNNLLILLHHLRCAAFELPFQDGEGFGKVPPEQLKEFMEFLREEGVLHRSGDRFFWMADRYPAEGVSLRSTSAETVLLQVPENGPGEGTTWRTIGEVDIDSANWMVHPGAVYLHEAQTYLVEELDLPNKLAHLQRREVDYYTRPSSETTVQLVEKMGEQEVAGGGKVHGEILVTTVVNGFRKIKWYTNENLGFGDLSLPPSELQTTGYWLALSEATVDRLRVMGLWTNDPNDYGPAWPALRDRVRTRDGYRCQLCGAAENGRSHDVHHKVPFRTFASREQANQLTNLITLCSSCHHRVETAVRMRSGLAGLGYVLGQLAPLYLMCDPCDLGVHSDPQSPLSEGKPTVVIYDQIPAGIGFSERLFELHDEVMNSAFELVSACECGDGCPSCVGPGGEAGSGGKREALAILELLH